MSNLLIHDTGRAGKVTVVRDAIANGRAQGMIISPFDTPPQSTRARPSAESVVEDVRAAGGDVWMDPATHLATAQGTGAFNIYDQWALWGRNGRPGTERQHVLNHVRGVIEVQRRLGIAPIIPTLSLGTPTGDHADLALEMVETGLEADSGAYVSIAGPPSLWTAGAALDAFVGQLVQLRPRGWFITVTREVLAYPPEALDPLEVAAVCRTVRSLALRGAPVIAGYSDLPGLPAIAAGATFLGTGGDLKQRCCAEANVRGIRRRMRAPRPRVSFLGLMASLKRNEAERLHDGDPAVCRRLLPGALPPADQIGAWHQHFATLTTLIEQVVGSGGTRERAVQLLTMYEEATAAWGQATPLARPEVRVDRWIVPLHEGLTTYALEEGWVP